MRSPNRLPGLETLELEGDIYFPDDKKAYFGADKDSAIYYDGENLLINPALAGSGKLKLAADQHLLLPQHNDAITPTLAFGDGDSGFFEEQDDRIRLALGGSVFISYNSWGTEFGEDYFAAFVKPSAATNTNPVFTFAFDDDSGLGRADTNAPCMIAGAKEVTRFLNAADAVNHLTNTPAAAGAAPSISVDGSDTDIDLFLAPKGAGNIKFGTHAAIDAETLTGYITIKDAAGNARKLAVVS